MVRIIICCGVYIIIQLHVHASEARNLTKLVALCVSSADQWVLYLAGPVHVLVGEVLEGLLLRVLLDLRGIATDGHLQILWSP